MQAGAPSLPLPPHTALLLLACAAGLLAPSILHAEDEDDEAFWSRFSVERSVELTLQSLRNRDLDDETRDFRLILERGRDRDPENDETELNVAEFFLDVEDLGATQRFAGRLQPSRTLGYALGSGDPDPDGGFDRQFRQTGLQDNMSSFNGVESFRYDGEALDPELSNLEILTVGFDVRPGLFQPVDFNETGDAFSIEAGAEYSF